MNPIDQIRKILTDYPHLKVIDKPNLIAVLSEDENGFDVTFEERKRCFIVSFGQWHEHLKKNNHGSQLSIDLFRFGLSNSCRLKVHSKGGTDYKFELEYLDSLKNEWMKGESLSLSFYPFWKTKQTRFLHNNIIKDENLGSVYAAIKEQRKNFRFYLTYTILWLAVFLYVNNFDIYKIQVSIILFSPLVVITLLLPLLLINNYFDNKKYGKKKKIHLNGKEKYLLFSWIAIWFLGILVSYRIFGADPVIGIGIIIFPIMLVVFLVPIFLLFQNQPKGKKD
jgi:hypothetical protein